MTDRDSSPLSGSARRPDRGLLGLTAHPSGEENLMLILEDGISRERIVVNALELAEAIARLEEASDIVGADGQEFFDDDADELALEAGRVHPWLTRPPSSASRSVGEYVVTPVGLEYPRGMLFLRRVMLNGPDSLEFETPSGSLYEIEYPRALAYLRPMLPH